MNAADRAISWSTALAVVGVAAVATVVSYERAGALVRARGESGWSGRLIPLSVDGLIYASSMVMRRGGVCGCLRFCFMRCSRMWRALVRWTGG
jgi:hypothetical protein